MSCVAANSTQSASEWLVEQLRPFTPFAEAIVRRQVERAGISYESLAYRDLPAIIPMIIKASSLFVDPGSMMRLRLSLERR